MAKFYCTRCREPVRDAYNRVEKRIEFRRKPNDERYAVILVDHLCRTCADYEIEQLRPTAKSAGEQGAMFQ